MSDWKVPYHPEPPGSPAYVQRLRDQAAVKTLPALIAWEGPEYTRTLRDQQQVGAIAVEQANALIAALGYQVPGEEADDA